ncbi:MAG: pyridoxamine 5'-phosphate oxidase family protein [Myxococcaceae bacterium]|nr:pyridoxamine 5'-phosphate oxidase family protein [Myxococcaceae bacterium]
MSERFLHELFTPEVLEAQAKQYGRAHQRPGRVDGEDPLGPGEREFLAERDSVYVATVTSEGWPYVQHRGGPPGFLKVLDGRTLAYADLKGNRQLITTGNLAGPTGGRVALIAVDYPRRERLKLLGHARVVEDAALAAKVTPPGRERAVERVVVIDVVASDWNCPAYLTPRYTVAEIETMARPLRERVAQLEAEVKALRGG